jgi:hypothetical protein
MDHLILPNQATLLTRHTTPLRARHLQVIRENMQRLFIMDLRQLPTIHLPLRELCQEQVPRQSPRDSARQDFIGCHHPEDKPAGVCLMGGHMLGQEEDTAAVLLMAIPIILLCQLQEERTIIAVVKHGILSDKGVLMALVREAFPGTDQNAYPLLLLAIQEEAIIIIIILPT